MNDDLQIRPWSESDSVADLTALLHDAFAALLADGFNYSGAYQDDAMTRQRLQGDLSFVAVRSGAIVGTITLYRPSKPSVCEYYCRPGVFHVGQFGVRAHLQRQGIGLRLYRHVEALARELGATELALDTAEGASHLRRWYERLGYTPVEFVQWPRPVYRSVVMAKSLLPA